MREKISKVLCVWRFTCDIMLQKTMKNMFFMLLLFVSFLLIGVSLIVIDFSSYDEKEITRLCDIDKTGRILLEWDEKNYQDFNLTEAAKLQNGHHYTSQYDGKGLIEETVMNRDMLNVMKLQWNRKKMRQQRVSYWDGVIEKNTKIKRK